MIEGYESLCVWLARNGFQVGGCANGDHWVVINRVGPKSILVFYWHKDCKLTIKTEENMKETSMKDFPLTYGWFNDFYPYLHSKMNEIGLDKIWYFGDTNRRSSHFNFSFR